jgi:cofilin
MSDGVIPTEEVNRSIQELQSKIHSYITFDVVSDAIVVDKRGKPNETFTDFISILPPDDTRFALVTFYDNLLFIAWAPDAARVRRKMIFASTKSSFKKGIVGISYEIGATDHTEIDEQIIIERVLGGGYIKP